MIFASSHNQTADSAGQGAAGHNRIDARENRYPQRQLSRVLGRRGEAARCSRCGGVPAAPSTVPASQGPTVMEAGGAQNPEAVETALNAWRRDDERIRNRRGTGGGETLPDSRGGRWRGWLGALPVMRGVLPIDRSRVSVDVLAGITLAALGIPEVLGYAKIAGMPVVTGLYTMLLPMAVFAVLGSSRHLVVAADSATAAILAAALTGLAVAGSERYVRLAGLAALLAGAMLLLARLARLGFLANFLSRTVLVGFLTGVGIQVAAGQLPDMLGVTAAGQQTPARLWDTVRALPHINRADVAVSIGVILFVLAARGVTRRIPGMLIAVIIAISVSWAADLASRGVAVVGPVPRGLPSLGLPALGGHAAALLLGAAASMFVVILAQSAATSRAYAGKYEEEFSEDTDLARSSSTAAPPRRRWSTARAAAANWPSSPPPPWSLSFFCCSPGRSPTCQTPRWRRWSSSSRSGSSTSAGCGASWPADAKSS
jgi:hypothetical protein